MTTKIKIYGLCINHHYVVFCLSLFVKESHSNGCLLLNFNLIIDFCCFHSVQGGIVLLLLLPLSFPFSHFPFPLQMLISKRCGGRFCKFRKKMYCGLPLSFELSASSWDISEKFVWDIIKSFSTNTYFLI